MEDTVTLNGQPFNFDNVQHQTDHYLVDAKGRLLYTQTGLSAFAALFRDQGIDIKTIGTWEQHQAACRQLEQSVVETVMQRVRERPKDTGWQALYHVLLNPDLEEARRQVHRHHQKQRLKESPWRDPSKPITGQEKT